MKATTIPGANEFLPYFSKIIVANIFTQFLELFSVSHCCHDKLPHTQQLKTNTTVLSYQFFKSDVWIGPHSAKIQALAGLHFCLKAPRGNPCSCIFWLLEAVHIPWLGEPSIFKASKGELSVFELHHSDFFCLLLSLLRDLWSHWTHPDNPG